MAKVTVNRQQPAPVPPIISITLELKFKHWLEAWEAKNAKVMGVGA